MKKYSPPRSTLNVSMPWMRRRTGSLRDRERGPVLLQADVRIALVAEAHEVAVVDPLLLQELHRGHRLGADEDEVEAARGLVVLLRERVRVVRRAVGRAAPDDAVEVHVGEQRHLGVARVHAPHVRAERHLPAVRIGGVGEVVVAQRVRAERRVVLRPARASAARRCASARPASPRAAPAPPPSAACSCRKRLNVPTRVWYLRSPTNVPLRPSTSGCGAGSGTPASPGVAEDELAGLDRPVPDRAAARRRCPRSRAGRSSPCSPAG